MQVWNVLHAARWKKHDAKNRQKFAIWAPPHNFVGCIFATKVYKPRWFTHPQTVTHPSTNQARRRVTSLIETNALPLSQVATSTFLTTTAVLLPWCGASSEKRLLLWHHCDSDNTYIFLNQPIPFYSNNATNLHYLTSHSTPCCRTT